MLSSKCLPPPHRTGGLRPFVGGVDGIVSSQMQENQREKVDDRLYEFITETELPLLSPAIRETVGSTEAAMLIHRVSEAIELGGYHSETGGEIVCVTIADEGIRQIASECDPRRYMERKRFTDNGKPVNNIWKTAWRSKH